MDRMKSPRWLPYAQWFTIVLLVVNSAFSSLTDHGFAMAVNCFMLGFVVMSMLAAKLFERSMSLIGQQQAMIASMAKGFEDALNAGHIDVHMINPNEDEHPIQPTRH